MRIARCNIVKFGQLIIQNMGTHVYTAIITKIFRNQIVSLSYPILSRFKGKINVLKGNARRVLFLIFLKFVTVKNPDSKLINLYSCLNLMLVG